LDRWLELFPGATYFARMPANVPDFLNF